jgi:methionyl-tRNA formyltransferase
MQSAGHEIVGVVTNPDRRAGRGRRISVSPVKQWAVEHGVPVLQPEKPRGHPFLEDVAALQPDISVVAAYGQILREEVLALPTLGSINVHGSVLPALRGAAPVNWAIISGHSESGVSIMRMVLALDAGPVFRIARCPIDTDTTAGELYDTLARLGGETLGSVLAGIADGGAVEEPQNDELATYAPKMGRDTARIDWSLEAVEVSRWIRGCDPWPGGWTTIDGEPLQCFGPSVLEDAASSAAPGTIVSAAHGDGLVVATGSGLLEIGEVRPAGKRRMAAADWVRGRRGLDGVHLV